METKTLNIALEKGWHPVYLSFFQGSGGDGLSIKWKTGDHPAVPVPVENWGH
jgi:hypothetical protein